MGKFKEQYIREQVSKLPNEKLNLRKSDFPTGKCGICKYFLAPTGCKIIVGPVAVDLVCNAVQGDQKKFVKYNVPKEDMEAFANGFVSQQPYAHNVVEAVNTPEGWIHIIKDTMKPKPHIFSIPLDFTIEHTSREHNWTQEEVNNLIKSGKKK